MGIRPAVAILLVEARRSKVVEKMLVSCMVMDGEWIIEGFTIEISIVSLIVVVVVDGYEQL